MGKLGREGDLSCVYSNQGSQGGLSKEVIFELNPV